MTVLLHNTCLCTCWENYLLVDTFVVDFITLLPCSVRCTVYNCLWQNYPTPCEGLGLGLGLEVQGLGLGLDEKGLVLVLVLENFWSLGLGLETKVLVLVLKIKSYLHLCYFGTGSPGWFRKRTVKRLWCGGGGTYRCYYVLYFPIPRYRGWQGFKQVWKQQKWPSGSLKVIGMDVIR